MNIKMQDGDSAFEALLEAIEETNHNDIAIAQYQKEICKLNNKKEANARTERILATRYFTNEKINEIHQKSVDLLNCNDFDQEEYAQIFSDISNVERKHISFLVHRQQEINEVEFKINSSCKDSKNKKINNLLIALADIFSGGDSNDD